VGVDWGTVVAAYAAGVSTIVGGQQVLRELPRVRVRLTRQATTFTGTERRSVLVVSVANGGRRPVTIEEVYFMSSDHYRSTPSTWLYGAPPFTLLDSERRSLLHEENGAVPDDAVFLVRDSLGRWWPRRRGLRVRVRRRVWRLRSRRRREPPGGETA
jgi:hypothetical protein